jgi:hypothetical protein
MKLTDIDGIIVDIDADDITGMQTKRKACGLVTEISVPCGGFCVKETPAEIIKLIKEEKNND